MLGKMLLCVYMLNLTVPGMRYIEHIHAAAPGPFCDNLYNCSRKKVIFYVYTHINIYIWLFCGMCRIINIECCAYILLKLA